MRKPLQELIRYRNLPEASNDLQDPSGESMVRLLNCIAVAGLIHILDPPTIAASHCPVRIASRAWSMANKLDEQAVSTVKLGPKTQTHALVGE